MSATHGLYGVRRFAQAASVVVIFVSVSVLLGWTLNVRALTSILPTGPPMVASTALAFFLAAISLAAAARLGTTEPIAHERRGPAWHRASRICAAAVVLIGLLRLADYLLGWNLGVDHLGFKKPSASAGVIPIGSMAPATALNFVLLGCALILAGGSRFARAFQALAILALLIGWLGFSRYIYGGAPLLPYGGMAIHTALSFIILGAGTLCVRSDAEVIALFTSDNAGGLSARRLLPAAVLVPLIAGWLPLYAGRAGWLGTEAGLSLFALSSVVMFGMLVWVNAILLNRTDVQRKQAQDAFQASEERTRLIVENALDAVIAIDSAGVIIEWSAQAESMFGWPRAEAVGRELAEAMIPERYREAHRLGMHRYLETGEGPVLNKRVELTALHRNQQEFPVEIAITPIRGAGSLTFSAFVRDITTRKQAEVTLRESEGRFRSLAESLPHLVWTCRPDGWCDYLSRQWVEYTGRSEEEQIGYGWAEQLHPDDRERVQAEWTEATVRGDSFDIEFRIRRADGVYRWFKTRAVPIRDAAGIIVKWFGSNTDFEDFKQAEEKLHTQLERLNLLDRTTRAIGERQDLQSIFHVVIRSLEDDMPADFVCACLYESAQTALSVTCVGAKSRALAAELAMLEHAWIDIKENGLCRCARGELVYEADIAGSQFPFPTRLAAGGLRSLVVAPLVVEREVFGVIVLARRAAMSFSSGDCEFLRQLSEHVALAAHQAQLYEALQRAYDDLRETQQTVLQQERLRALGQMASGVAHDINNALSPAALYAQSLLERDASLSDQARDYLVIIQRAIEDVAQTVARMREFYRPRGSQLTAAPVEINRTLEQVVELTRVRWNDMPQERGIVIRMNTDFGPDLPLVLGDESEIRDAVTNLILNAVDAMPEGGVLTVRSRGASKKTTDVETTPLLTLVYVEVCDTGIGMDEVTRSHCLEPFFTTKGERGTGLGLAMVYGMLQRRGAGIEIESELDTGTTVRLIFSATSMNGAASGPPAEVLRQAQASRILIIDDDSRVLNSLRGALEQDGHSVAVADNGRAGVDSFILAQQCGEPFAGVITDLGMPHMDGRNVAAAIKSASPRTPVILLTGWGSRLLAGNELPPHVDRVLSKPPKLSELRAALAELTLSRSLTPKVLI
jgi:PAS domain S-box-containing protein